MRPRRVGEILDAAIKIYIRNARTLMGLTAVVVIPMRILAGIVLLSTLPAGSDVPGGTFTVSSSSQPVTDRAAVLGANGTLIVIELIVATLVTAACTKAVSDAYLDQPMGAAKSLWFAVRRLPALLVLEYRRMADVHRELDLVAEHCDAKQRVEVAGSRARVGSLR